MMHETWVQVGCVCNGEIPVRNSAGWAMQALLLHSLQWDAHTWQPGRAGAFPGTKRRHRVHEVGALSHDGWLEAAEPCTSLCSSSTRAFLLHLRNAVAVALALCRDSRIHTCVGVMQSV